MNTIDLKRGDTLDLLCVVQQEGLPLDIAGWLIACEVRAPGGALVHRFAAHIVDAQAGQYRLLATAGQTARWPLGGLSMDIRYTDAGGRVATTATVPVQVRQAITG